MLYLNNNFFGGFGRLYDNLQVGYFGRYQHHRVAVNCIIYLATLVRETPRKKRAGPRGRQRHECHPHRARRARGPMAGENGVRVNKPLRRRMSPEVGQAHVRDCGDVGGDRHLNFEVGHLEQGTN